MSAAAPLRAHPSGITPLDGVRAAGLSRAPPGSNARPQG